MGETGVSYNKHPHAPVIIKVKKTNGDNWHIEKCEENDKVQVPALERPFMKFNDKCNSNLELNSSECTGNVPKDKVVQSSYDIVLRDRTRSREKCSNTATYRPLVCNQQKLSNKRKRRLAETSKKKSKHFKFESEYSCQACQFSSLAIVDFIKHIKDFHYKKNTNNIHHGTVQKDWFYTTAHNETALTPPSPLVSLEETSLLINEISKDSAVESSTQDSDERKNSSHDEIGSPGKRQHFRLQENEYMFGASEIREVRYDTQNGIANPQTTLGLVKREPGVNLHGSTALEHGPNLFQPTKEVHCDSERPTGHDKYDPVSVLDIVEKFEPISDSDTPFVNTKSADVTQEDRISSFTTSTPKSSSKDISNSSSNNSSLSPKEQRSGRSRRAKLDSIVNILKENTANISKGTLLFRIPDKSHHAHKTNSPHPNFIPEKCHTHKPTFPQTTLTNVTISNHQHHAGGSCASGGTTPHSINGGVGVPDGVQISNLHQPDAGKRPTNESLYTENLSGQILNGNTCHAAGGINFSCSTYNTERFKDLQTLLASGSVTMPNTGILQSINCNQETWNNIQETLHEAFSIFPYLSKQESQSLARYTGLTEKQVKALFVVARLQHGISWEQEEIDNARKSLFKIANNRFQNFTQKNNSPITQVSNNILQLTQEQCDILQWSYTTIPLTENELGRLEDVTKLSKASILQYFRQQGNFRNAFQKSAPNPQVNSGMNLNGSNSNCGNSLTGGSNHIAF